MTPAIKLLKRGGIQHHVHQYQHDSQATSYGLEAVEKLGVDPKCVFKTLVIELADERLAVAVIPTSARLNLKALALHNNVKKAVMADPQKVERSTGYVLGGVSPLGQKKRLSTIIDSSAEQLDSIFVSAGKRGLEIELSPQDLAETSGAVFAEITA